MYDVSMRIKCITKMERGKIPSKYQTDTDKKYKSESEKFLAIKKELNECSRDELDNLKILFKCKLGITKRDKDAINIVVYAIPLILAMYSFILSFLNKMDYDIDLISLYNETFTRLGISTIICICLIFGVQAYTNSKAKRLEYIIGILDTCCTLPNN